MWGLDCKLRSKGKMEENLDVKQKVCGEFARKGDFKLLRIAHYKRFPLTAYTSAGAARGGHLDILKWVYERGAPLDEDT